jgi:ornithine carbamoyltransferase
MSEKCRGGGRGLKKVRHFLCLSDYSRDEILAFLRRAGDMKRGMPGPGPVKPLDGRSVALIFEKPSTRTRVSFEVGVRQLGGQPIFLSLRDIQLGRGEPIRDTARVLSRYVDALVIRTFGQEILEKFAKWSTVPVINALSDKFHPCQILGDLMTLEEIGVDIAGMKAAWIGDGNNVANSWINAAKAIGFRLALACPEGYDPILEGTHDNIILTRNPKEAIKGADVVSTDVWASMGQEEETEERTKAFRNYQVNEELLDSSGKRPYVLHCLPAHRGEEITDEAMECEQSLIWDQAENRLHIQKAILEKLVV